MATSKTPTPKKTSAAAKATKAPAAPKAAPAKAARVVAKPAARPAKAPKAPASAKKAKPAVSSEQRRHYIEVAAYFIAERHGFMPGRSLEDWAAAEMEIDRLLAEGLLNT